MLETRKLQLVRARGAPQSLQTNFVNLECLPLSGGVSSQALANKFQVAESLLRNEFIGLPVESELEAAKLAADVGEEGRGRSPARAARRNAFRSTSSSLLSLRSNLIHEAFAYVTELAEIPISIATSILSRIYIEAILEKVIIGPAPDYKIHTLLRQNPQEKIKMSYDPKVFELGWDFILAGERYRTLNMDRVPLEDQYEMCGLFKQSTFGDIDIKYVNSHGHVLRNCQAWQSFRGISKPEAIKRYVAKSEQLIGAYKC